MLGVELNSLYYICYDKHEAKSHFVGVVTQFWTLSWDSSHGRPHFPLRKRVLIQSPQLTKHNKIHIIIIYGYAISLNRVRA